MGSIIRTQQEQSDRRMMDSDRLRIASWPVRQDLWAIVLFALALRLTYLLLGATQFSFPALAMVAPDSNVYAQLADHYRLGTAVESRLLLVAGPGYPMLLASFAWAFGPGLWPPVLLNLVLGALAPLAVYLLAAALVDHQFTARLSALLVALSFTGLSMSTSLLTDQPFYTLHAFGLLFFVWGLQSGNTKLFIAAGFVATVATAIRSLGQLWPWIFMALSACWLLIDRPPHAWRIFLRSLWVPAMLLALIVAWSAHNSRQHGIFTFTTNGVRASWAYLVAASVADHTPGGSFDSVRTDWSNQVHAPINGQLPPDSIIHQRMKSQVLTVLREHPGWVIESFFRILRDNVEVGNYFAESQLPRMAGLCTSLRDLSRKWINPLLVALTALGGWMLLWERKWKAALILGITYAYFTLTTGFSFWQGSRLHFPAEMAWAILVPYGCARVYEMWNARRYPRADAVSV